MSKWPLPGKVVESNCFKELEEVKTRLSLLEDVLKTKPWLIDIPVNNEKHQICVSSNEFILLKQKEWILKTLRSLFLTKRFNRSFEFQINLKYELFFENSLNDQLIIYLLILDQPNKGFYLLHESSVHENNKFLCGCCASAQMILKVPYKGNFHLCFYDETNIYSLNNLNYCEINVN